MSIYYIESKVLSPDGKRLALTFVADGKAVAVSAGGVPIERQQVGIAFGFLYTHSNDYLKWILTGLDTSSIIPALDKALQVWQKQIDNVEYAATISVDKTLWNFTNTGDGWTCVVFLPAIPLTTFSECYL